jgi:hypothetical protein
MAVSKQLGKLAEQFQAEFASAKEANIKRYQQALDIQDQIIAEYTPGGGFGAGYEAQLERQKTQDVGRVTQHAIDTGMFGVQTTGAAGQRWEAEVGAPARLQLEDVRRQRYTGALQAKEGVIERRTDAYPEFGLIADLYREAASGPGQTKVTYPATPDASDIYEDIMSRIQQPNIYQGGGVTQAGGGFSTDSGSLTSLNAPFEVAGGMGGAYVPGSDREIVGQVGGKSVNVYGEEVTGTEKDTSLMLAGTGMTLNAFKALPSAQQKSILAGIEAGGGVGSSAQYAPAGGSLASRISKIGTAFGGGI